MAIGVYSSGCDNEMRTSEDKVVIGLTVLQVYRNGYHIDMSNGSITLSEAKAKITTENYRDKIVRLAFSNNSKIAKIAVHDTIVCQINKEILEKHLDDIRYITKAYSHIDEDDLLILSVTHQQEQPKGAIRTLQQNQPNQP